MIIIVFLVTFHHTVWTLLVHDTHQDFTELTAADERLDICHYHVDDGKGNEMFHVCHDVTAGEVVFYGCREAVVGLSLQPGAKVSSIIK